MGHKMELRAVGVIVLQVTVVPVAVRYTAKLPGSLQGGPTWGEQSVLVLF
jgi:hypothetical protein